MVARRSYRLRQSLCDSETRKGGGSEAVIVAINRERVTLLALGSGGYACLMFAWFSLPAFLSTVATDLHLTNTQGGLLVGAVPLTYVPVALFSGVVVDHLGSRRVLGGGLVVVGAAHGLRAEASGFPAIVAFTLLLGVGGTGITFGLPKLAADLYPDHVGRSASVYLLGSYAGTAAAFGLGRPTLGPALGGWRPLFRLTGLAVFAFALTWAIAAHRLARDVPRSTPEPPVAVLRAVLSSRPMALLVVVGTAYLFLIHGLQGWLPSVLETRGIDPGLAGRITTLLVAAQVVGVVAVPVISKDRRGMAIVGCGLIAATGTAGLAISGDVVAVVPLVVCAGIGVGGLSPLVRAVPVDLADIGPERTGTAVGLVFAVGEIGGFLGPTVLGVLRDETGGFSAGLLALAAGGVAAALAGMALVNR